MKRWVIACAPCDEDFVVETHTDEKPEYCPKCGDCDTAVWEKQTEEVTL